MSEAHRIVHDAVGRMLDEGEIAVSWVLTIDVAGPDDTRYLAHRAGGGVDGSDAPMIWAALGMLQSAVFVAKDQLMDCTADDEESDE